MSGYPRARNEGIVSEEVGDELVVYAVATQTAHALSKDAASVWKHCDGHCSAADIAARLGLEEARVAQALEELSGAELLEEPEGIPRRALYKRTAKLGAAALGAQLIYSVAIGPATAAASTPVCTSNCPVGAVVQCGAGTCPAQPGNGASPSSSCASNACYQGKTNNTCYCAQIPGCAAFGNPCGSASGFPPQSENCCAGNSFQFCTSPTNGTCTQ